MRLPVIALTLFFMLSGISPAKAETEILHVLGYGFSVQPFDMPETELSWADVKDAVPAGLQEKPAVAVSEEDVVNEIDKTTKEKLRAFEASLAALAVVYKKDHPGLDDETVEQQVADLVRAPDAAQKYPDAYQAYREYTAMLYVGDMVRKSLGL